MDQGLEGVGDLLEHQHQDQGVGWSPDKITMYVMLGHVGGV